MKFVGYYRVSTDKQENSADMQPSKLADFAKYKKINLVKIFGDEDVSGGIYFSERKGGKELIDFININTDIDGVLITNLTRAFRNAIDGLTMLDTWTKQGLQVFVIDENGSIDVTTPDGFMNALIKLGLSHWERLTIKKRTKEVLTHMKNNGQQYARDKYGFDAIDDKFVVNEKEQDVIKLIVKLIDKMNLSFQKAADYLNDQNIETKRGGKWIHTTVRKIHTREKQDGLNTKNNS